MDDVISSLHEMNPHRYSFHEELYAAAQLLYLEGMRWLIDESISPILLSTEQIETLHNKLSQASSTNKWKHAYDCIHSVPLIHTIIYNSTVIHNSYVQYDRELYTAVWIDNLPIQRTISPNVNDLTMCADTSCEFI